MKFGTYFASWGELHQTILLLPTDILKTVKENFKALEFKSPISFFKSKEKAVEWIKGYC